MSRIRKKTLAEGVASRLADRNLTRPPRDRMVRSDEVWRRVRREARKERALGETLKR